jgi:hypothetical protein
MDPINKQFAEVIAHSWSDEDFHKRLLADPTATLIEAGMNIPEGTRVVMVENTADVTYVVIPERPAELSDEELDTVAGGLSWPCGGAKHGMSQG